MNFMNDKYLDYAKLCFSTSEIEKIEDYFNKTCNGKFDNKNSRVVVNDAKNGNKIAFDLLFSQCFGLITSSWKETLTYIKCTADKELSLEEYMNDAYVMAHNALDKFDLSRQGPKLDVSKGFVNQLSYELLNARPKYYKDHKHHGVNFEGTRNQAQDARYYNLDDMDIDADDIKNKNTLDVRDKLSYDFKDEVTKAAADDEFTQKWAKCCTCQEWTLKHNIRASIFKTLVRGVLNHKVNTMVDFIKKSGVSKAGVLNYLGKGTYDDGNSIPDILSAYDLTIGDTLEYFESHPKKVEILLNMLPGGYLFESTLKFFGKRID